MKGLVYDEERYVGSLSFEEKAYLFEYDEAFLNDPTTQSISLTLPKQKAPFRSKYLFSFFANLLAEGNLKKIQCKQLKIDENDAFTRLLKTANSDTIGAITIKEQP